MYPENLTVSVYVFTVWTKCKIWVEFDGFVTVSADQSGIYTVGVPEVSYTAQLILKKFKSSLATTFQYKPQHWSSLRQNKDILKSLVKTVLAFTIHDQREFEFKVVTTWSNY